MTSNPGWFPQPDGRERYYDGQDWTDEYRSPPSAGAQPQGAPLPPPQQKKRNPWKWIVIIGFIVLVLCFGGFAACTAGVLGTANEVNESIESAENEVGGTSNAVEVTEGEAFEVRGFNYAEGWSVGEQYDMVEINDLKVTNNRDNQDGALVQIKFMQGDEILATSDCTSGELQVGQTATLDCISADALPDNYDSITINDSF